MPTNFNPVLSEWLYSKYTGKKRQQRSRGGRTVLFAVFLAVLLALEVVAVAVAASVDELPTPLNLRIVEPAPEVTSASSRLFGHPTHHCNSDVDMYTTAKTTWTCLPKQPHGYQSHCNNDNTTDTVVRERSTQRETSITCFKQK